MLISILREVYDPRDINARHDLGALLFLALAATLCGAPGRSWRSARAASGRPERSVAAAQLRASSLGSDVTLHPLRDKTAPIQCHDPTGRWLTNR